MCSHYTLQNVNNKSADLTAYYYRTGFLLAWLKIMMNENYLNLKIAQL